MSNCLEFLIKNPKKSAIIFGVIIIAIITTALTPFLMKFIFLNAGKSLFKDYFYFLKKEEGTCIHLISILISNIVKLNYIKLFFLKRKM